LKLRWLALSLPRNVPIIAFVHNPWAIPEIGPQGQFLIESAACLRIGRPDCDERTKRGDFALPRRYSASLSMSWVSVVLARDRKCALSGQKGRGNSDCGLRIAEFELSKSFLLNFVAFIIANGLGKASVFFGRLFF